jgi:hypothetical protein
MGAAEVRRAVLAALVVVAGAVGVGLFATSNSGVKTSAIRVGCSTTVNPQQPAATIAKIVADAQDGATICMSSGSYPFIHVVGAAHGAYVTVRPAAGATATVAGVEVANSSFLRFMGLHMTEGFNMRDAAGEPASHDYQFIGNTFEEPLYGIALLGAATPIKKVLIEGNYIHYVHLAEPEKEGKCNAGYAAGQDVSMYYAEGVTIAHNIFRGAELHYLQGGGAGPEGVTVDHNLFEGRIYLQCSHLNLWQIWSGGANDTFTNNIAIGEPGQEAATDGLIFENGRSSRECGDTVTNSVIEDNLFVDAASSYEIQLYTAHGARISHNTVVGSQYGTALLTESCGAGSNYTMTHNIDVEDGGSGSDLSFGACTGACTFNENVSEDESAQADGASRSVIKWSPAWKATAWNPEAKATPPAGYYIPTGLSISAGYEGGGGS